MIEILSYSFFQNAIIGWIIISLISSILWTFIIMRKEANITHSISNFLFLWIAISLLFNWNYYLFAFLFWIIWSITIFIIEKTNFVTKESSKEIISQLWLAWAIFCIWFLWNLSLDINNLLFWSILFINTFDLIILSTLLIIVFTFYFLFWKKFFSIIINEDIAKSKWIKTDLYNFSFLLILSFFIWVSIKIFWIMLVWAFLIIPVNVWKILWYSIKSSMIITNLLSIISVIFWLFLSYFIWTNAWSTIVLILILFFIFSLVYKSQKK